MFQQMLNASRAVLLRPSVSTFEEHERNDLGWALIYIAIGAVLTAILSAVGFALTGPALERAMRDLQDQLGGQPLPPGATMFMGGAGLGATLISSLLFTIIGFFFWTGIVYLLGRAFGGTGAYGELAYDIALFQAPLTVVGALLGIVPIPCVSVVISLALGIYQIYLSWLSIQAGMNLPGNKAAMVILIPVVVILLLVCGCIGLFAFIIAGASQQ